MKKLSLIGVGLLLLAGCKSLAPISPKKSIDTVLSSRVVQQQIESQALALESLQWRGDAQLSLNKKRQRVSITTRIKKGEAVWVNGSMIIPLGRLMITPTSLQFYEKIGRRYAQLDYRDLKKRLGIAVDYSMLENVLTAKPIVHRLFRRTTLTFTDKNYVLTSKKRGVSATFEYDAAFRLIRQTVGVGQTKIEANYGAYVKKEGQWIPQQLRLGLTDGGKTTSLQLRAKQTQLNGEVNIPFVIPSGYTSIVDP